MLRSLDIRDMLIIDHLVLDFRSGLNVLTGETGAGKSILLDALGFVLGWRGRADLVRQGAEQGEVTALFEIGPDHPAMGVLAAAGIPADDGEVILRRVNRADGRKTAWVNDRRVSGEVLRSLSDWLVELHGQQDDRGLLNESGHRDLLDDFGGHRALRDATGQAWRDLQARRGEIETAEAELRAARAEEEYLRHAGDELARLAAQPGEEARLDGSRRLMRAAAAIGEDVARAEAALGMEGATGLMVDALRRLESVAPRAEGRLDGALEALARAMAELAEAETGIEDAHQALHFDPGELERVEERLFAIRALARKHDCAPDELPDIHAGIAEKLSRIETGEGQLADLRRLENEAAALYDARAAELSAARHRAAAKLDAEMAHQLAPLRLENATFSTMLAEKEPGPAGKDAVAFTISTNPGVPAGPLSRVASGGELSRFLLALKACLTRSAADMTLIFDEIDRGVGGATADAVGRRLAALAEGAQILVVTHSPQVAAKGGHHWRVSKSAADDMTLSRVVELDAAQRIDEIARMLAGDRITDEARAAARALLSG